MVIPYAGALNAFLAIYSNIPYSIRSFIVMALVVSLGVAFLKFLMSL